MELDKLKLQRTQLRRMFTKSLNEFESTGKGMVTGIDLQIALKSLEDKVNRLFALDSQVVGALIDAAGLQGDDLDAALAEEYDSCESYREKWMSFLVRYDPPKQISSTNSGNAQPDLATVHNQTVPSKNLRLPKLEIKPFDGNLRNWIMFWGQFRKIHENTDLEAEDKFHYLVQATVPNSPARELVESFPPSKENYQKAIDVLKGRFARDELLIEVYVRDLLSLVLERQANSKPQTLCSLYDKIIAKLHSLESLGVTSDKYAAMLFPLVESALPEQTLIAWERHRTTQRRGSSADITVCNDSVNYLGLLLDFLKAEVESEKRLKLARGGFALTQKGSKQSKTIGERSPKEQSTSQPTASAILTTNNKSRSVHLCLFCGKSSHGTSDCISAIGWSLDKKKDQLKKSGGCFICLKQGHSAKLCRSIMKCFVCGKRHHTIMCPSKECVAEESQPKADGAVNQTKVDTSKGTNVLFTRGGGGQCYLQTLVVKAMSSEGQFHFVRVLLDSGSQRSYVSKKCIQRLNLQSVDEENLSHFLFGGVQLNHVTHYVYNVTLGNIHSDFTSQFKLMNQETICNYIPRFRDRSIYKVLRAKGIVLTDMDHDLDVEILLGADAISKILTADMQPLENGLLATKTKLGWTVIGQHTWEPRPEHSLCCTNLNSLDISQLWKLETLGITDAVYDKKTNLEEGAMEHFTSTVSRKEDGRYNVQLPWVSGHPDLLTNEDIARKRLLTTTKKLVNGKLFEEYDKVFKEWEELGIVESTDITSMGEGHFIPHHPVVKETSLTTKVRPVFDASAKDKNGNSLNGCLVKGPNLVAAIPNILLRFRLHKIGVSADIAKAFLQIEVQERDRDFLKFLWWKDNEQTEIKGYRHCRVVFGLKSSPFLLGAVINHLLDRAPEQLKNTAAELKVSFYVDNCVTSVKNEDELSTFIDESKTLMMMGKFDLRCWVHTGMKGDEGSLTSLLGLLWDSMNDTLSCNVKSVSLAVVPVTKRVLLSVAQSIFDPIGFTCPVSLVPKLLLQETWKMKISWDAPLPEAITKPFHQWMTQIHLLNGCSIPRRVSNIPLNPGNGTLHVFSDASKVAYAACIFLRVEEAGKTSVQLVSAKSRIAPSKQISIPRLELLAALIATRLYTQVKEVLESMQLPVYFWTDSTVVLAWIKRKDDWNTFVANRCKEIREKSDIECWRHVPGNMNPADIPSRGCSVKDLCWNKWWEGPEWLRKPENEWPNYHVEISESEVNQEKKKTVVSVTNNSKTDWLTFFDRFSKYTKILRVFAWILRFLNNISAQPKRGGELTGKEIKEAENRLIGLIQKESFPDEKGKMMKNLNVHVDPKGIFHVKSRLILRDDQEEFKCPILLPSDHPIVHKLIRHYHEINQHAGVQMLLHILRENFWILGGRKTIKSVLSKCIRCKRHNAKPVMVPFAPLPNDRIKDSKVFEVTGVDLTGPLFLKSEEKAWIVVFTCAVYRAVHFELIKSLSTEAFLQSFRRFIARRGRPAIIYSDNGTNFCGASHAFNRLDWNEIVRETSLQKMTWKFNPPSAAWWGGWWERIIGMLKDLLRRTLGKSSLIYEELYTVLCDCESVLNARPLTYVSSDNDDLIPLSPAMFLQDLGTNEVNDMDEIDRTSLTKRLRYIQKLREDLRSRFRREYLGMLVSHSRVRRHEVRVGDIMLVEVENVKRLLWPIGLVKEVFVGRDGIIRLARLKTANGEITRPVQKLYPLEINSEDAGVTKGEVILNFITQL